MEFLLPFCTIDIHDNEIIIEQQKENGSLPPYTTEVYTSVNIVLDYPYTLIQAERRDVKNPELFIGENAVIYKDHPIPEGHIPISNLSEDFFDDNFTESDVKVVNFVSRHPETLVRGQVRTVEIANYIGKPEVIKYTTTKLITIIEIPEDESN